MYVITQLQSHPHCYLVVQDKTVCNVFYQTHPGAHTTRAFAPRIVKTSVRNLSTHLSPSAVDEPVVNNHPKLRHVSHAVAKSTSSQTVPILSSVRVTIRRPRSFCGASLRASSMTFGFCPKATASKKEREKV